MQPPETCRLWTLGPKHEQFLSSSAPLPANIHRALENTEGDA